MLSCSMTTHNYFPLIFRWSVKPDSLYSSWKILNGNMSGRTHCRICTLFCYIVLVILPDMFCCLAHHHELSKVFASLLMLCVNVCVLLVVNAKAIHPRVFIRKVIIVISENGHPVLTSTFIHTKCWMSINHNTWLCYILEHKNVYV